MQSNGSQPNGQWGQPQRGQRPGVHASYREPQGSTAVPVGGSGPGVKLLGVLLGASVAIAAVAIGAAQSSASPAGSPQPESGIVLAAAEAAAVIDPTAPADTGTGSKDFDAGTRIADQFLDTPAGPPNGLVATAGPALAVRVGPAPDYRRMGTVAAGTSVVISCRTHGAAMAGRYGKTDSWNYVPALGGFVSSGFVFSQSGTTIADCSAGMDGTAGDPGGLDPGSLNPSVVQPDAQHPAAGEATDDPARATAAVTGAADPAAPATVTRVVTSTARATTTRVSTVEPAPAEPETVTVTETVPADQGEYPEDEQPADPETVYQTDYATETERQTEYRTATERQTEVRTATRTQTSIERQTITKTIAGAPVTVTVPGAPTTVTVTVTAPATSTSEPRVSCGLPCGGRTPTLSPLPTRSTAQTSTPQTSTSGPRVSCGYPCGGHPTVASSLPTTTTKAHATTTKAPTSTTKPAPPRQACHGFARQRSCGAAVTWAKNHVGTVSSDYDHRCDHVAGLAYGLAYSGSFSALSHWGSIPKADRHPADRSVPAGGLAFFGGSQYGHVMISIGDGKFVSNDIKSAGRLSITTIAQIEKRWGLTYLGWSQPWFAANH